MATVNFNQDCSSLAIGTENGYQLYTLKNISLGELERIHSDDADKNMHIVERLFNSSLVALVNRDNPNSLKICHFKKGSEICKYNYPSKILSVKLNRQRLVVCLSNELYIHNIRDMKKLQTIVDTGNNLTGLSALSVANDSALLAYPSSGQQGCLAIYDAMDLKPVLDVEAHNGPLAAIMFSHRADMVATASVKGTVIRTFSTSTGEKLHEFRRGIKRCVTISSLAFSKDGAYLAASSNTETVHIFSIFHGTGTEVEEETTGWTEYLSSAITASAASLIPTTVSTAFSAWRAFATARLPNAGKHTVVGLVTNKGVSYVLVAVADGLLHVFKLAEDRGGDCELITTRDLNITNIGQKDDVAHKSAESFENLSTDSLLNTDPIIGDASYAYKLKSEKKDGPCTLSQQLNEIVDNVAAPVSGE